MKTGSALSLIRLLFVSFLALFSIVSSAQDRWREGETLYPLNSSRTDGVLVGDTVPIKVFVSNELDENPRSEPLVAVRFRMKDPGGKIRHVISPSYCLAETEIRPDRQGMQYIGGGVNPCLDRTYSGAFTFDETGLYQFILNLEYQPSGPLREVQIGGFIKVGRIVVGGSISVDNVEPGGIPDTDFLSGESAAIRLTGRASMRNSLVSASLSINGELEKTWDLSTPTWDWAGSVRLPNDGDNLLSLRVADSVGEVLNGQDGTQSKNR